MIATRSNPFLPESIVTVLSHGEGELNGLKFAVKELFDVKGRITGCGNPYWMNGRSEAAYHAPCIQSLLDNGASLYGRTVSDEMAFSLDGENVHYGTPVNPAAKGAIAGGSSAGSASAVADGLVDFALGTDTAGSVRIPAAYCGLYGFRPSHGLVPIEGVHSMAKTFDVVGWFAKSPAVMEKVSHHFLAYQGNLNHQIKLIKLTPLFTKLQPWVAARYDKALSQIRAKGIEIIEQDFDWLDFELFKSVLPNIQWYELNQAHGHWIREHIDTFGEEIKGRLLKIDNITDIQYRQNLQIRQQLIEQFNERIGENEILILPTAPDIAPAIGRDITTARSFRAKLMDHVCVATIAGLPQLNLPILSDTQAPLGISLMARKGQDCRLLNGLTWL